MSLQTLCVLTIVIFSSLFCFSQEAGKSGDEVHFELEFDGPVQNPGIQVYGIEGVRNDFQSVLMRERPTNQVVIKLKEGVNPQQIAEENGLKFEHCLKFSKSLCVFSHPQTLKNGQGEKPIDLQAHQSVEWVEEQVERFYSKFQVPLTNSYTLNPLWSSSWHLNNTYPGFEENDVNIVPSWDAGWSGRGIRIGIVDDSVEWQHPDLVGNYVPETSWDFNGGDGDPSPGKDTDVHGTSVTGVAAGSNNNVCGLGAAFNSKFSGLRLISDGVSDATIAQCLTISKDIDIYSNSWGWSAAFGGSLSSTLKAALAAGVSEGRNGKGAIYSWAAGNSRQQKSNANYDSLANAPETIAVAAVSYRGIFSYYSNPGCALMISAPSNGDNLGITTTDRTGSYGYSSGSCTSGFGGTSSACPLVSGVIALVLEANPNLGWRDVQWVLAMSARKNDPTNSDWRMNGAGFWVNHNYGFGLIDATKAIETAKTWKNVPQRESVVQTVPIQNGVIPDSSAGFVLKWKVDRNLTIEHVQVTMSFTHRQMRGLTIDLLSPSGTLSRLMDVDAPTVWSLLSWTFMSVFNWGENSYGEWTLKVVDRNTNDGITGQVSNVALTVWGHQQQGPSPKPTPTPTPISPPTLEVDTSAQCSDSKLIKITAKNTQLGMVLSAQSTNLKSQVFSVVDSTSTSEDLVLQFQRPVPEGSWTVKLTGGGQVIVQQAFDISICAAPAITVNAKKACEKGVLVKWKNAPSPSYAAIVPETSTWVSSYSAITAVSGDVTFNLEDGQYRAFLVTEGFQVIVGSEPFRVECQGRVVKPVLKFNRATSKSAVLSWKSLQTFGIENFNFELSKNNISWQQTRVSLETQVKLTQLSPQTTYYARVQGIDNNGVGGEWSDVVSFQTSPV